MDYGMDLFLEQHLRDMGLIPLTELDGLEEIVAYKYEPKVKFNDPRDENGEVPY